MREQFSWIPHEIGPIGDGVGPGDTPATRRIQEWLSLRGYGVAIDGHFGPATEQAVKNFQSDNSLPATGVVDQATFDALVAPMTEALACKPDTGTLGQRMVAVAQAYLSAHPREVGGQNRGPWVRLFMEGNEGKAWPWCAGFACFIMRQAACSVSSPPSYPVKPSFSCDDLAAQARTAKILLPSERVLDPRATITPGSIFLHRKNPTDWTHAGIVVGLHADTFETIEGNTNDEGSREGYEVCRRSRAFGSYDFILIP